MSNELIFITGVTVFSLMLLAIALTVLEFRQCYQAPQAGKIKRLSTAPVCLMPE